MQRVENWQSKLDSYLIRTMDKPFKYGRHDCCMSVAHCIKEITGENVSILKVYNNKEKADKIREEYGNIYGVVEHITKIFNVEEIPISYATGGDIVVAKLPPSERIVLGVVGLDGRSIYTAKRPRGWSMVPLLNATKAYRI